MDLYNHVDRPGAIGAAAKPVSGDIFLEAKDIEYPFFKLRFCLSKARVPVTDGAASGSHGSLKLFDFVQQAIALRFSRAEFTDFDESSTLTGGAGDANFKIGVGSTAVAAPADSALTGTSVDLGSAINVTLAGGNGTGKAVTVINKAIDGTVTPASIYLNVSGSAASVDANGYIEVTGDITITGEMLDGGTAHSS